MIKTALRDHALLAIRRLPRLSIGGSRLLAALARREVDMRELVAILQQDPLLSAHVLQIANSGAFGRLCPIETIQHAVAFLGPSTLRRHIISWTVLSLFKRLSLPRGWSTESFTAHSGATALLADLVCDNLPAKAGDAAMIAGLLHDVGKLVICAEAPDSVNVILELREHGYGTVTECEREVLGIDHAEISSIAAELWRLSEDTWRAIRYHHDPETDSLAHKQPAAAPVKKKAEAPLLQPVMPSYGSILNERLAPLSLVLAKCDAYANALSWSFLSSSREANSDLHFPGFERETKRVIDAFERMNPITMAADR